MPERRSLHRGSTRLLATIMVVLGLLMIISTIAHGGGPTAIGLLLGVLFVAAGGGRLYVQSRIGRR